MQYPHRLNRDGSIDAICPRCYATIAECLSESDLIREETNHMCDPARLEYYEEERRRAMKKGPEGTGVTLRDPSSLAGGGVSRR